ncbi:MAG: 16S rRNA (guanine(527)-N(7))-methyltransferase RsmG [Desulfobacterales bacterium]|nr:16S rRNA (guanine(527)-N(7))-methyltransferase RsmG [Desulfobacterales bacterium]
MNFQPSKSPLGTTKAWSSGPGYLLDIGSVRWKRLIREGGKELGIRIEKQQADQFAAHAEQMLRWNLKINLTAITNPFEMAIKHYLDSIVPIGMIPSGATLLDVGSGGGFPGIPIKIMRPDVRCTLIDPARKKVSFLKQVVRDLNLKDIEVRQVRVEDLARDGSGKHVFKIITARALAPLETFTALALPLLASDGMIVAFQGKMQQDKMDVSGSNASGRPELPLAHGSPFWLEFHRYRLPYLKAERTLVVLRKRKVG